MSEKESTFQAKNIAPSPENLASQISAISVKIDSGNQARIDADASVKRELEIEHRALADKFEEAVKGLRQLIEERHTAHAREHTLVQLAIETANSAMKEWKLGANEWRAESKDRQEVYATKAEQVQISSRLEGVTDRNFLEIKQMIVGKDGLSDRIRSIEDFKLSVNAQIAGLRNLMAAVSFIILIAAFVIARFGN